MPYIKKQLAYLMATDEGWGLFCCTTLAGFDNHYPPDKSVQFFKAHPVCFPRIVRKHPIDGGRVVFTGGSSSGIAAVVSEGQVNTLTFSRVSAQQAELEALCLALNLYSDSVNVYTDSVYVANIIKDLETASDIF